MGVHGLWRLIEPSGKPVPLETLENKVLAVDISIWLHQAIKGFQDSKGAPVPNAHLLGIYHRVCKLLYFKIKPIFVFDGGVPVLKKQTIAKRNQLKSKNNTDAERLQKQLLNTLMKHTAISKVLSETTKASLTAQSKKGTKQTDNLYVLPSAEVDSAISSEEDEEESTSESTDSSPTKNWDLHTIDMNSIHFKSLPVDVRHEILTELKETRKQNSWGRLHELPKQSDDFSVYQMKRLLKRQAVQAALEEAAQEMGGMSLSLAELESILKDQGIQTTTDNIGKRIASDENTRYLFIRDVKQAMEKARQEQIKENAKKAELVRNTSIGTETGNDSLEEEHEIQQAIKLSLQETPSTSEVVDNTKEKHQTKADIEEEKELERAIALSLQQTQTSSGSSKDRTIEFSYLENLCDQDSDSESDEETECSNTKKILSSAESYMMEYSGLTPNEISKIIGNKVNNLNMKTTGTSLKPVKDATTDEINDISDDPIHKLIPEEEISNENEEIHIDSKEINKTENDGEARITEIMSDSDESTDFQEVTELKDEKISMEIIIDPNKGRDLEDDLFGDIFANDDVMDSHKTEPQLKQPTEISQTEDHPSPIKQLSENISNISVIRDDTADKEIDSKISEGSMVKNSEITKTIVETERKTENQNKPTLSTQEMIDLKNSLQKEKTDLMIEKATKERLATNITDQMYQEAQELLELFGVPYIIAPMEAEAQCAFLDEIELTDGTITDDSDVWLFGGRTVYKNFFNQSKYVMEFKSENIKHNFKLSREQMILLALLVGSDYTTGIPGIGPVTALEILAAFPPAKINEISISHGELISGLREFRSWYTKGKSSGPNRSTLKNKLKNITFTENFPSSQVVQAYLEPTVEESREKFSWDKPDVVALTLFAREKFGWGSKKTEEILKPVMKKFEENRSQKSIREYYKTKFKADSGEINEKLSKRVKTALERFGKSKEELIAEEMEELEKGKEKVLKNSLKNKTIKKQSNKSEVNLPSGSEIKNESSERPPSSKKQRSQNNRSQNSSTENDTKVAGVNDNDKAVESDSKKNGKTRGKDKGNQNTSTKETKRKKEKSDTESTSTVDELKEYENLAAQLRLRRKKKNELIKLKQEEIPTKKTKLNAPKKLVNKSNDLVMDDEVKLLIATSSKSLQRQQEIKEDMQKRLNGELNKRIAPPVHKEEVIHQRLRSRTDSLRNKLKAIEVFRKSNKGPGYVQKREKKRALPKEDAGLSEDSDD